MKRQIHIIFIGLVFILILFINIFTVKYVNSTDKNLALITNMTNADDEDYGNGHYGFCYSGCWPDGIEIVCYPWPNSYCIPVGCTMGWC